jgi:hypothetical protein
VPPTNEEIISVRKSVHDMRNDMASINTNVAVLTEGVTSIAEDVKTTKEILTGNGKPEQGLVFRVATLEREGKKRSASEPRRANRWLERAVLTTLLPTLTVGAERLFGTAPEKPTTQHVEVAK